MKSELPDRRDYLPGYFLKFSEKLSVKPLTTQVAVLRYDCVFYIYSFTVK